MDFESRLKEVAKNLKTTPDVLRAVMHAESRMNPAAVNPNNGATGLIQFTKGTAKWLGTTLPALRNMSAVDQLSFVEKYYRKLGAVGKMNDVDDAYMFTFHPQSVGKENNYVLPLQGRSYRNNAGMDHDKDGRITVREVKQHLRNIDKTIPPLKEQFGPVQELVPAFPDNTFMAKPAFKPQDVVAPTLGYRVASEGLPDDVLQDLANNPNIVKNTNWVMNVFAPKAEDGIKNEKPVMLGEVEILGKKGAHATSPAIQFGGFNNLIADLGFKDMGKIDNEKPTLKDDTTIQKAKSFPARFPVDSTTINPQKVKNLFKSEINPQIKTPVVKMPVQPTKSIQVVKPIEPTSSSVVLPEDVKNIISEKQKNKNWETFNGKYYVLSKESGNIYAFDKTHKLIDHTEAGRGSTIGDFPNIANTNSKKPGGHATTRSGSAVISKEERREKDFNNYDTSFWRIKYNDIWKESEGLGLHGIYKNEYEFRKSIMENPKILDKLISWGCVNIDKDWLLKNDTRPKVGDSIFISREPVRNQARIGANPIRKGR